MAERLPLSSLVAVLEREAERDYPLSASSTTWIRNWKKDGRRLSRFSDWYHLVSLHVPARQVSPRSVGFEVSEVVTTVMRVFFRFLPSQRRLS